MVKPMPVIMPAMAPSLEARFQKMPSTMMGKKDDEASPKARATTWATKPGGLMPKYPAIRTPTPIMMRPTSRRIFSDAPRLMMR